MSSDIVPDFKYSPKKHQMSDAEMKNLALQFESDLVGADFQLDTLYDIIEESDISKYNKLKFQNYLRIIHSSFSLTTKCMLHLHYKERTGG